jgi:hypothetical protein
MLGSVISVAVLPLVTQAASAGWPLQPSTDLGGQASSPEASRATFEPGRICDPSWCSCTDHFCQTQSVEQGPYGCDLCSQKWVFVFSAGGRTGSTSLLEGLNALPGVSLIGENFAMLNDLQSAYAKVSNLVRTNTHNNPAAFSIPNPHGVRRHTLCAQQSLMAGLAGSEVMNTSIVDTEGGPWRNDQIYGFKELIQPPSSDLGGAFESEVQHFSMRQRVRRVVCSPRARLPAWPVLPFSRRPCLRVSEWSRPSRLCRRGSSTWTRSFLARGSY